MIKVIIVGGKGNGTVVLAGLIDMIQKHGAKYSFLGFVNDNYPDIDSVDGFPVIGKFENIKKICIENDAYFINAITSTKTMPFIDEKYLSVFSDYKSRTISIIHPTSFVGYNTTIGKGVFVGPNNYIGQNVFLDDMVFIHSQSYIARDSNIAEFSYIAPQGYIGADVRVKRKCYFGINALVREKLTIDENTIIGMGAIILESTTNGGIYFGEKSRRKN